MNATKCCALCTRAGDFGDIRPDDPHSGLCPHCVAAGYPTRVGMEQAVVTVATLHLAGAERLNVARADAEDLVYHVTALTRSLRSVLQLINPAPSPANPAHPLHHATGDLTLTHLCAHCRTTTTQPHVTPTSATRGMVVCAACADALAGGESR